MRKNEYKIRIPKDMYKEVKRLVGEDPTVYSSIEDFTKSAIREEIFKARRTKK